MKYKTEVILLQILFHLMEDIGYVINNVGWNSVTLNAFFPFYSLSFTQ